MIDIGWLFGKFLEISQFIGVLSFLVVIHEIGHYLTAKWSKVRVEEFGLGYPPRVKKLFTYKDTIFSLNWIPFGGFVKMEGEDVLDTSQLSVDPKIANDEAPFYEKRARTRLMIILAGAFMNFAFGIIAFSIYFSAKGIPALAPNPRIGEITENSPAAQAKVPTGVDIKGIRVKDTFIYTDNPQKVTETISQHQGEYVTLVTSGPCKEMECDPQLQEFEIYIRPESEIPVVNGRKQGHIGVGFEPVIMYRFYPWYEMPVRGAIYGTQQALGLGYLILMSLGDITQKLAQGVVPTDVAGLPGIFDQGSKAGFFSTGILELLYFSALLSINLAIMNILPIPALDGGRAFFIFLELIIGKKYIQKVEGYAHYGGFIFLITLIILITIKDIRTIFFP